MPGTMKRLLVGKSMGSTFNRIIRLKNYKIREIDVELDTRIIRLKNYKIKGIVDE